MDKREFLKLSGNILAVSMLSPILSCREAAAPSAKKTLGASRANWANNLIYDSNTFYEPRNIGELQQIVKENKKIKALGTKHCFNKIADSRFSHVSIRNMNRIVSVDSRQMTATIEGGASYGQICTALHEEGYALHNLASLPHISLAGAIATATHGSGVSNSNLGAMVSALEFINTDGDLVTLSRNGHGDEFSGMITHLGGLGILTKLTLDLQPTFQVRQDVYQHLPVSNLLENFEAIMAGGYSVSLFTDYQSDQVNQVWVKSKVAKDDQLPTEYFGAISAERDIHPILELSAENCTAQMGVPGPWFDRLPHFKMDFTPSSGKELQSEYFVPLDKGPAAYEAIQSLKDEIAPYLMISEVRTIAADNQWMSPCYEQKSAAFHFTWQQDWKGLKKVLPLLESKLEPFNVRPHWGKMFTMTPAKIHSLYPRLVDFKTFLMDHDANGKFRNDFLQKYLYT